MASTMSLVDHDTFLKKLVDLFESTKDHGSIWLTHKRLTHDGEDATMKEAGPSDTQEYPCLVRVTNGKGVKFSTKVDSTELIKFHSLYGSLLKSSMTPNLRKRDKKREKARAEEAAKRRKRVVEPVKLTTSAEGDAQSQGGSSKRGKGRRTHQRKIKALLKQQEAQKRHREREEAALVKAGAGASV